ncbi:MAG TPA: NUDIX domain-containing protein [Gaiellaceae bacterium]|nr:NUDIX domain-containing protein [Gaiellaceae bacterium]
MSDYVRRLRERVGHGLLFFPSAACLVRDDEGRVLLVRSSFGRWTLPAGAVDPGETPAEAAVRETREEAGVEVELISLAGVFGGYPHFRIVYPNGDEAAWVTSLFEARIVAGTPEPDGDEVVEVRWATLDEARDLGVHPATLHMLESVAAGRTFDPPASPSTPAP